MIHVFRGIKRLKQMKICDPFHVLKNGDFLLIKRRGDVSLLSDLASFRHTVKKDEMGRIAGGYETANQWEHATCSDKGS